ncbi:MAG: hypothetical protein P8Z79_00700 [Sedimentisphaerales bacterium]|jgi:hypothetical protein
MTEPKQKPSRKFRSNLVSAAVWENSIQTDKGPKIVENITFQRSYKDAETGQWKNTDFPGQSSGCRSAGDCLV